MDIQILPAVVEDLSAILALQKECYLSEAELHNAYDIPPLTQTLEQIIHDFNTGVLFLKGVVDGQIIASVRGSIEGHAAHIGRLIVATEYQNNGYGRLLMQAIETAFNHAARYELFTGDKSVKNILLYQKIGYSEFKRATIPNSHELVFMEKITHSINL